VTGRKDSSNRSFIYLPNICWCRVSRINVKQICQADGAAPDRYH
jgi:hypothetical protein